MTLVFGALSLTVSTTLALGTYLTARHYLVDQREQIAGRQAFADASFVRDGLLTSGTAVDDALAARRGAARRPSVGTVVLQLLERRPVPGVDSVLVTRDGSPVEVPLPGGALTDQPVRASDYAQLIAPAPTTTTH